MWTTKTLLLTALFGVIAACACNKSAARDTNAPPPTQAPGPVTAAAPLAAPELTSAPAAPSLEAHRARLVGAGSPAEKLRPYLQGTELRQAFDAKRWHDCAVAGRKWLSEHAKSPDFRAAATLTALCDEHAGNADTAARSYEKLASTAVALAPILWLRAAESWLAAGQARKALAALDKIDRNSFARGARADEIRGRAWRQLDDHKKAYEGMAAAAQRGGGNVTLLFDTAEAAAGADDPEGAARWLKAVLVHHPGNAREAEAVQRLSELSKERATLSPEQKLERAENARRRHKRKLAMEVADELLGDQEAGSRAWCDAGVIKARALETWWPRRKEAAALYDKLARTCPMQAWTAPLRYRAAKRQMNSASQKRAIALFDEVAQVAPSSTLIDDAMRYQARMLESLRQPKKAAETLEKILGMGGDMVEYAGWDLLWKEVQARRWKRCVAVGKKVLDAAPTAAKRYNVGRARYWTAVCELRAGQKKAAKRGFAAVAKAAPVSWYGMLARQRLVALGAPVEVAPTASRKPSAAARDLFQGHAGLVGNRHFIAGIELMRLGMKTSAAAELAAAPWDKKDPTQRTLRAQLHAAVDDFTRATAIASMDRSFDRDGHGPEHRTEAWRVAYPRPDELQPLVAKEARQWGVDPMFVWAIMRSESRFNRRATSPVLATGLLQLMPGTARTVAKRLGEPADIQRVELMQPPLNIHLGTAYMARLLKKTGGHYALVASGYNAGPHNTSKWQKRWPRAELDEFVERIPFRENRRYVKSVVTSWLRYSALYSEGAPPQLAWQLRAGGAGRKARADQRR